jgi:hypothetical protein
MSGWFGRSAAQNVAKETKEKEETNDYHERISLSFAMQTEETKSSVNMAENKPVKCKVCQVCEMMVRCATT